METDSYIVIECTYPHEMMMHMRKVVRGDLEIFKDQPTLFSHYCQAYPEDGQAIYLLETAYRHGIIDMFFEKAEQPEWSKRVFLETSLRRLVRYISEKEAVVLLESLMFQFRWDISMQIKRQWESPPEERADFHNKTSLAAQGSLAAMEDARQSAKQQGQGRGELRAPSLPAVAGMQEIPPGEMRTADRAGESTSGKSRRAAGRTAERKRNTEESEVHEDEETVSVPVQEPEKAKFYPQMNQRIRRVLRKAIGGDVSSQCGMGDYYAEEGSGHGDYFEALRWYKLAAYHGNDRAIFELGRIYSLHSPDVPDTEGEALRWFENLARRGFPTAQCILGMKYRLGDGVESNLSEAAKWLEMAAKQRHETAIRHLGDLYASVNDDKNAEKWYRIGATCGDAYCIGRLHR